MKSVIRKIVYTFLFLGLNAYSTFAVEAADSDVSNTAGSNSGHINISPFILVVLFLILAATAPFYENRKKNF